MKRDKGLHLLDKKHRVQFIIEQVQPADSKTTIVSENAAYKTFGLEVIPD